MALAALAAGLYPDLPRVAGTDLLCWPGWLPSAPLDLADVALGWVSAPPPAAAGATGGAAAHVLPRAGAGQVYPTYAAAIGALDRPALFENRVCYRLLDAGLGGPAAAARPGLSFGPARYFDAVNLGAAVAHELTRAWSDSAAPGWPAGPGRPPAAGVGGGSVRAGAPLGHHRRYHPDPAPRPRRHGLVPAALAGSGPGQPRGRSVPGHARGHLPAGLRGPGGAAPRLQPVAVHDPGVQRGTAGRLGGVPDPRRAARLRELGVPSRAGRRPGGRHPPGRLPRPGGRPADAGHRHPDRGGLRGRRVRPRLRRPGYRERGGAGGDPGRFGRDPLHPGQRGPLRRRG